MSNNTIYLSIASLVYIIILVFVYFSKDNIQSTENNIFQKLVVVSFFSLCSEIMITFIPINMNSFLFKGSLKLYLILCIFWLSYFMEYVFTVTRNNKDKSIDYKKKYKRTYNIFWTVTAILIFLVIYLPIYFFNENGMKYSYGPSVNIVFSLCGIYTFLMFCYIVKNIKNLRKSYLPIILLVILLSLVGIVQKINPSLLIANTAFAVITFTMFFTIENPDVKILNELYKNKEIMESNYEDKYNFLFEITQESRNPLKSIESICNNIEDEKDIKVIKENVKDLSNLAKRLDFTINNVMNVSTLDAQKINIIDKKYNLKKVCEELTKRISLENKKDVEFKYSIPHNDLYLYGDDMKIKQVLYSLIVNSLEKTNIGYVEFKVNVIEKYDYARVIFMVTDSGPGIEIDKINEILSSTGALDKEEVELLNKKEVDVKLCQKVIKLMGGNLMIKSDLGKGSEFILTIDQRVYHDETKSILSNYENVVNNYQKALIVSQDKTLISKIKNILNKNGVSYSVLYYGLDAVDKIKSHKKYDFILISDEMKEVSGLSTLKEMQKVKGFSSPCIVMLNESKKGLAKHYIEDGFSDYIINEDIDSLNKILEKY